MPLHIKVESDNLCLTRLDIGRTGSTGTNADDVNGYLMIVASGDSPDPESWEWNHAGVPFEHRYGDSELVCLTKGLEAARVRDLSNTSLIHHGNTKILPVDLNVDIKLNWGTINQFHIRRIGGKPDFGAINEHIVLQGRERTIIDDEGFVFKRWTKPEEWEWELPDARFEHMYGAHERTCLVGAIDALRSQNRG